MQREMHMRLGFIGLGSMGAPMAMRLAAWPGGLVVHDLREEATEPLAAVGATVASCVADVAAADLIGIAVLDDAQVREVVVELARHAGPDTVIAVHSTVGDTTAAELAARYAGERIHVIDAPETRTLTIRGMRVALGAFPYVRKVRGAFSAAVADTGLLKTPADVRLLVVHHAVEGVAVGAGDLRPDLDGRAPVRRDFVFTEGADVIRGRDVPAGVAAVLSGHIHRHQIIEHDLAGRPLAAPVVYAGSVERTSPAEAPHDFADMPSTAAEVEDDERLMGSHEPRHSMR